mmetsp:Transcript_4396/g.7699  ORF Transcript_4396/g.7699 Transcript_4396/m.7699 type:complete len:142 (+) Transcript_4396:986-1411(+)
MGWAKADTDPEDATRMNRGEDVSEADDRAATARAAVLVTGPNGPFKRPGSSKPDPVEPSNGRGRCPWYGDDGDDTCDDDSKSAAWHVAVAGVAAAIIEVRSVAFAGVLDAILPAMAEVGRPKAEGRSASLRQEELHERPVS